jgi:uncharacterized repeat protein (TIGR01451 family)
MFKGRIQMRAKLMRMFLAVSLLTTGLLLATPTPSFACHITVNWDADCEGFSGSVENHMGHSEKFQWKVKLYQGDTLVEEHSEWSGCIDNNHTYHFPTVTWEHTPMCGPFFVKAWVRAYRCCGGDYEEREYETWNLDCPCTSLEMDKTSVVSDTPLEPGSTVTYNIVVSNPASSTGSNTNIVVSDPLPTGTSYVSGSSQVTAPASVTDYTVRDEFNDRSYGNNNGTVLWAGDWQEIGETQGAGPTSGEVQVRTDGRLRIGDQDYSGGDPGAWRTADLSDATSATFSFDYQAVTNEDYDWLAVQVSSNGGGSWHTLKTFKGSSSGSKSYDISSYASANTAIRFKVTNRYGGDHDFFYADNVQIAFSRSETTTAPGGAPPDLVTAADGYNLLPGESMSVTFQVTVNNPVPEGLTEIENTACVTSDQVTDPLCDTTTDPVEQGGPQAKSSIGDYVWHDLFHSQTHQVDGVQDDGEPGLEGVLVELYQGGVKVDDYTTGASGYYQFTDLDAGSYTVKIADSNFASGGVLEDWFASPPNQGDDAQDSDGDKTDHQATVTLGEGEENNTIDFGFFYSCIDLEKTGPDSVGVDGTITYHFRVENCGDVVLHGAAHVYDPLLNPCGDHEIWNAVVWPGEAPEFDRTYTPDGDDCGELVNTANAVGHSQLDDYGSLPDVTDEDSWTVQVLCSHITVVKQTNPDGDTTAFEFTASYDEDGFQLSDGQSNDSGFLTAGTYSVNEVNLPDGWELDSAACDDGSAPASIDLGVNEHVTCTFNNVQEAGPGSICLPSIDFDTDARGNPLAAGTLIAEQWSDWGVHITTSNPTNHPVMIFDSSNPTGNDPDLGTPNQDFSGPGVGNGGKSGQPGENSVAQGKILIISGDGDTEDPDDYVGGGTITFTFDQPTPVDEVHILDIEESGSKVRAWNATSGGTLLAEVNMQTYGNNSFQIVPVNADGGVRRLEIIFEGSGGVAAVVFCSEEGSLGDYVWEDVNRDGIQDDDEPGISGVNVDLYLDANSDGVPQSEEFQSTDVTNGNGLYLFTGLAAGDYIVKVADSNFESSAVLYSYFETVQNAGDDAKDSDGHPTTHEVTVTLASGENNMTIDFGFSDCEIGDRVWNDEDGEGDQDANFGVDEPGLNGVDVYLYKDNGNGSFNRSEETFVYVTTTISGTSQTPDGWPDGIYGFDMTTQPSGDYWVWVDESTLPSPGSGLQWKLTTASNPLKVAGYVSGDIFSFDFGYVAETIPTAVTLSSFTARPSAGGFVSPRWLGMVGLVLASGSLFWKKRRAG